MLQRDKSIILSVSIFFRMVFPIHSDQSFLKHLYSVSPSVSKTLSTLIWKTSFETLFNSIVHRMINRSFLQLIYCPYEINCIWYNTPTIFQILPQSRHRLLIHFHTKINLSKMLFLIDGDPDKNAWINHRRLTSKGNVSSAYFKDVTQSNYF